MKYKKNKLSDFLEKNEGFQENFQAAKKQKKNDKIKYIVKRKRRLWLKISLTVLLLLSVIVSAFFYFFSELDIDTNFDKSDDALGLLSSAKIHKKVTNIAIFGLDKRKGENSGRSDAIMVVSFDGIHKKIKITSILRDTRLSIDGHGQDKLGHAFSYGGANLAVKTLNKNFHLDIRDYVALNFGQLIHIVDAFGGIDVKVAREHVSQINGIINSTPEYKKSPKLKPFKEKFKILHLNGAQALSLARMRKKDDEHHRAARQQIVLNLLLEKLTKMKATEYPGLLRRLMPYTETSLSLQDILGFVPFVLSGRPKMERDIIPHHDDPKLNYGIINGVWYWRYDLKRYSKILHDFIYEEESTKSN